MQQSILQVTDLSHWFDGVAAVDTVSFGLAAGTALGVIGPNGAGKSTLLSLLGGQILPHVGSVVFDGHRIDRLPAHRRCALGLGRTFQIPRPFRRLTVRENLLLAGDRQAARADSLLRDIGLADHAGCPAGELSGGQHKLLDIARALMTEPSLLLLDEPCAGVAPALVGVLDGFLASLRRGGVTIMVVEHDIGFVARNCDEVMVMVDGGVLTRGVPDAVCRDRRVQEAFLGAGYV
jgi:branched-chain amino acid transport system ATP-binding protein